MHDLSPSAAPADAGDGLSRLGELIATSRTPSPDLLATACELTRQAGGHRLAPGVFSAALLDLADRIGRVPSTTWLSLCRGMALGASVPGQQGLPLPLRQAAARVVGGLLLPEGRRVAMAQALMIDAD